MMIAKPRQPLVLLFYLSVIGILTHSLNGPTILFQVAMGMLTVTAGLFTLELCWGWHQLDHKRCRQYTITVIALLGLSFVLLGGAAHCVPQGGVLAGTHQHIATR